MKKCAVRFTGFFCLFLFLFSCFCRLGGDREADVKDDAAAKLCAFLNAQLSSAEAIKADAAKGTDEAEYQLNSAFLLLQDRIAKQEDDFASRFAGLYIQDRTLYVLVTEKTEEDEADLRGLLGEVPFCLLEAEYTNDELSRVAGRLNQFIGGLLEKRNNGELSGDLLVLSDAFPVCCCSEAQNRVTITFACEKDSEELARLIGIFEAYAGEYEAVVYAADPDFEPARYQSSPL